MRPGPSPRSLANDLRLSFSVRGKLQRIKPPLPAIRPDFEILISSSATASTAARGETCSAICTMDTPRAAWPSSLGIPPHYRLASRNRRALRQAVCSRGDMVFIDPCRTPSKMHVVLRHPELCSPVLAAISYLEPQIPHEYRHCCSLKRSFTAATRQNSIRTLSASPASKPGPPSLHLAPQSMQVQLRH